MDPTLITESPFGALTFIVAPALLTNASSVLAMSTITRMLRTRDRMQELFAKSEADGQSEEEAARLIGQANRVKNRRYNFFERYTLFTLRWGHLPPQLWLHSLEPVWRYSTIRYGTKFPL
jgi:hypothetical protein